MVMVKHDSNPGTLTPEGDYPKKRLGLTDFKWKSKSLCLKAGQQMDYFIYVFYHKIFFKKYTFYSAKGFEKLTVTYSWITEMSQFCEILCILPCLPFKHDVKKTKQNPTFHRPFRKTKWEIKMFLPNMPRLVFDVL